MKQLTAREALAFLRAEERDRSVVITDPSLPDNPIVFVSEEFARQTGYGISEAMGRNCRFMQGPETDPHDIQAIRDAIREQRPLTVDILNYRKDGTRFWNRLRIRPLFDDRGRLLLFVGTQNPIAASAVRRFATDRILD